jgi:flagellar protein FlbD
MIEVTRLNGKEFYVNSDLVLFVEKTPDTVITLINERKLVVLEDVEQVVEKIVEFKRKVFLGPDMKSRTKIEGY